MGHYDRSRPARRARHAEARTHRDERPGATRPLAVTGAIAACAVMVTGLVILTPLVLVGWIAAPHAGLGLPGVLRTATGLWLAAHHVGFALRGAGRIGMLPLGLVLIPGALLWRAGRWVVRTGQLTRLSEVGYAAMALAAPYAVLCGALALASRSRLATPSLPQAVVAGFLHRAVAPAAWAPHARWRRGPRWPACCRRGPAPSSSARPGRWRCSRRRARCWPAPRSPPPAASSAP